MFTSEKGSLSQSTIGFNAHVYFYPNQTHYNLIFFLLENESIKIPKQTTYFKPRPLRCWPIRRIMSWSVCDLIFVEIVLWTSPLISTLSSKEQVPFCKSLLVEAVSPLWQPLLACMLVLAVERRCFFFGGPIGGGDTPPSESALDARLASNATFF